MKNFKAIKFSEDFIYDDKKSEYTFRIKKRNYLWLWLLLLALFCGLCCIRCSHDITVRVVDHVSGDPITQTEVTLGHTEHSLFKGGRLFYTCSFTKTLETDENGIAVFEDMPCSVFSYIFYAFSNACLSAENECNYLKNSPAICNFHYTWNETLKLQPKTEDVFVNVVDSDTSDPLAGAAIYYNYTLSGKSVTDSVKTDAGGRAAISGLPRCGNVTLDKVSCYGYQDTIKIEIPVLNASEDPALGVIPLLPKKDNISFKVINKFTKQAIPYATVTVVLTTNNGRTLRSPKVPTNVRGTGYGESEKAFVLSKVSFEASKDHYRDTILNTEITLEKYRLLPETERVIELEPLPYEQIFQNVDSITKKPIAGVLNRYTITRNGNILPEGKNQSNDDGFFSIWAMEGDQLIIESELSPIYEIKHTEIESFDHGFAIPMKPRFVDLKFRTIDASTQALLSNCNLWIFDSQDNEYKPNNSGNGTFIVKNIPTDAILTISAEKDKYRPNNYTIHNKSVVSMFKDYHSKTIDIPLDPLKSFKFEGNVSKKECYELENFPSFIEIEWKLCSVCTLLIVSDENGNVIGRFGIDSPKGDGEGITYTEPQGKKTIECNTKRICLETVNVNSHSSYVTLTPLN